MVMNKRRGVRLALVDGGFPPEIWGPHFWFIMHLVASSFPLNPSREQRAGYHQFFQSLKQVLPCEGCKKGYTYLVEGPLPLTKQVFRDRLTLFSYTVALHNAVNKKAGKPVRKDWTRWYRYYEKYRSG